MPVIVAVLVISSLAGGTYIGYQRGYADSAQTTNPDQETDGVRDTDADGDERKHNR